MNQNNQPSSKTWLNTDKDKKQTLYFCQNSQDPFTRLTSEQYHNDDRSHNQIEMFYWMLICTIVQ